MPVFEYIQNNSGGYFTEPALYVFIEAEDEDKANDIAIMELDMYFDGVAKGVDCSCCGDRWNDWEMKYESWEQANKEIERYLKSKDNKMWAREAGVPIVLKRYADGRIERNDA